MKLSHYYKQKGYEIELKRLRLPYYPGRKKTIQYINTQDYSHTLCSCVYSGNIEYIKGNSIIFGGTGYSLSIQLSDYIESIDPDYSLYPENDTLYGFITRGCSRKCKFCQVPKKEGYIRQVSTISKIVNDNKEVYFLDNNILAFPEHYRILKELVDGRIKCQFNQGLDIRLVDELNSQLLSELKYTGSYTFGFDDIIYLHVVEKKLKLLNWRNDWYIRFFLYVHPSMSMENIVRRIEWCKKNKCLAYIMRDISCWGSLNKDFYIDIASWCNQPNLFKKMTFEEFLPKRHKKHRNREKRIEISNKLYKGGHNGH